MARMLSLSKGGKWCWFADFHPRYRDARETRQRNRAYEKDAVGRELKTEALPELDHDPYCLDELGSCYDGMCDCWCHGDQDWKRGGENDCAMMFIDMPASGVYTVG